MLKWILSRSALSHLKFIEQRFFVNGHNYNSCDRSFALVDNQRKKKLQDLFHPQDWINIMRNAKSNKAKITVTEMEETDFFSCETLEKLLISKKSSADGNKIKWFNFMSIIHIKNENSKVYKTEKCTENGSITYFELQMTSKKLSFCDINLNLLYPGGRPITKQKYDDLQTLLSLIPAEYHEFYRTLKYTESNNKDYALAIRQSSDEEESGEED